MIVLVNVQKSNIWTAMDGREIEVTPITDEIAERLGSVLVDKEPDRYYSVVDSSFNRQRLEGLKADRPLGQYSLFLSWAEDFIFKKRTALIDKEYTKSLTNYLNLPSFKGQELRCD